MKKRILLTIILCLFIVTACRNNSNIEKIIYSDSTLKLTTIFEYDKEDGFKKEKDVPNGKFAEIEFSNEKANLYFDMYYTQNSENQSKKNKENRKNNNYYKEYKYNGYEAYVYSNNDSEICLVITLKKDDNQLTELFVIIDEIRTNRESKIFDIFDKNETIQDFFKSIKITEDK